MLRRTYYALDATATIDPAPAIDLGDSLSI